MCLSRGFQPSGFFFKKLYQNICWFDLFSLLLIYQITIKNTKMNTPKIYAESVKSMINSNYSEKSVDVMFQAECMLDDEMYTKQKYAGMDLSTKQDFMRYEWDEIAADNAVYDYYND